ncbi:MAG: translesion error-prone DNA polymerase V autoproteolytic subunit [Gammaproteobacteria bacterium]|nr:translesion error-prone DNA polymerase V autoproteolytic subunit [Gammaproteobacteria bacterium]
MNESQSKQTAKRKKTQQHGGARPGAGRPKGSGKYKEPTKAIRVPVGSISHIEEYLNRYPEVKEAPAAYSDENPKNVAKLAVPLYSSRVAAGHPSPAEDHIDDTLDLNEYMVRHPDSTFMLRVEGESMKDVGILPHDILVVDRSIPAQHNKIVIAALDGELTVKRLFQRGGMIKLCAENQAFDDIEIESEADLVIWGVVIGSFRRFQSF